MKSYRLVYKIASVIISMPLLLILLLSIVKPSQFSVITITLVAVFLYALWKSNRLLKSESKKAFTVSLVTATTIWLIPAYQIIQRINFIIENDGMERKDGYASPVAFLLHFMVELYFFVPLSIVLFAAVFYYLRSNKTF